MSKISATLKFLNTTVVIVIFTGLLVISGMGLFALSPIAYEDYVAYKSDLDQDNLAKDSRNSIAGVSTASEQELKIINLLEGTFLPYSFSKEGEQITLQVDINDSKIDKTFRKNIDLVKFNNESYKEESYVVEFNYSGAEGTISSLSTNPFGYITEYEGGDKAVTMINLSGFLPVKRYVLKVPARSVVDLAFVRDKENADDASVIFTDFKFSVSLQQINSPEEISELP